MKIRIKNGRLLMEGTFNVVLRFDGDEFCIDTTADRSYSIGSDDADVIQKLRDISFTPRNFVSIEGAIEMLRKNQQKTVFGTVDSAEFSKAKLPRC